ncbi:MAG: DNA mismatch repair endonuclease MutL [Parachlamydiaceae bacterium]
MSSKIRVLSEHTINKIAAGEVIENPSSVVKELVENSLDAGASVIDIEINGGGRQLIRISDNGCGMNADDALLCLERHATSKLRDDSDMHTLLTMGFRGEAIPSIASISKFNLLTCPQDAAKKDGTMVIVDGGKLLCCTPAVRSPGTTIEVKSLFFNVPGRKKFLKSPGFDANEIFKTVSLIALGHPAVTFHLISDGKTLLKTTPVPQGGFPEQMSARIISVLGDDFFGNSVFVDEQSDEISVRGAIGLPGYTRHNRTGQYLFINKRAVMSPLVSFAVKEGFSTSIDSGRFPVFVLHLSLAGEWVDVNVHPQKREVRLRQEQMIKEMIVRAIRKALGGRKEFAPPISSVNAVSVNSPSLNSPSLNSPSLNSPSLISPVFAHAFGIKESLSSKVNTGTWEFQPKPLAVRVDPGLQPVFAEVSSPRHSPSFHVEQRGAVKEMCYSSEQLPLPLQQTLMTPPKVIAAIPRYLIVDESAPNVFIEKGCRFPRKGGLVLIDQRQAHARIIFEKLSRIDTTTEIVQQTLLVPHTLELSPQESAELRLALPYLNDMSIHIKEFGEHTFLIDAVPQIFGDVNLDSLITDIVHDARLFHDTSVAQQTVAKEQTKKIALAASRTAISGGRLLSLVEGQSLVNQLVMCQQPYICPAGKPTLVQITGDELAKLFQKREI